MARKITRGRPTRHGNGWQARWTDENGKRHTKHFPGGEDGYRDAEYYGEMMRLEVYQVKIGIKLRATADRSFAELTEKWLELREQLSDILP